jgi:hypothetical protein
MAAVHKSVQDRTDPKINFSYKRCLTAAYPVSTVSAVAFGPSNPDKIRKVDHEKAE